jgi:hypothetical protein
VKRLLYHAKVGTFIQHSNTLHQDTQNKQHPSMLKSAAAMYVNTIELSETPYTTWLPGFTSRKSDVTANEPS